MVWNVCSLRSSCSSTETRPHWNFISVSRQILSKPGFMGNGKITGYHNKLLHKDSHRIRLSSMITSLYTSSNQFTQTRYMPRKLTRQHSIQAKVKFSNLTWRGSEVPWRSKIEQWHEAWKSEVWTERCRAWSAALANRHAYTIIYNTLNRTPGGSFTKTMYVGRHWHRIRISTVAPLYTWTLLTPS